MVLILLVGGTLFIDSWSWPAVGFALFLFFSRTSGACIARFDGVAHIVALTLHGRMVWRTRHRLALLSHVCHPAQSARGSCTRTEPPDIDRG